MEINYADNNQRARKRYHTLYWNDDGYVCSNSPSHKGRYHLRVLKFCIHGDLYGQYDPALRRQCHLSLCEPDGKIPEHLPQAGSYDDLCADRRLLHSGVPHRPGRAVGLYAACTGLGNCVNRHGHQSLLDHLSKMVLLGHLHCHGLGMPTGVRSAFIHPPHCRLPVAAGWGPYLHRRWYHLCAEAAAL